ncbi:LutC/YkgG family protein [Halobacillus litoralis]|uniref:LutC/YkgG family protein n=1 Tax=Halobacillus litoralis TaxID=45668 RepID=UPI001CFE278B|nr:lactate utilization protein C [Halobacillus litoralis]
MVVHNRERFLDQLAERLNRPRRTQVDAPVYSVQPQDRVFHGATQDELVHILEEQCKVIHTDVIKTTSGELADSIRQVMDTYKVNRLVSAGGPRFDSSGLIDSYDDMRRDGYLVHVWEEEKGQENVTFAEKAGAGIVFSDITLAESGTVTLFNDRFNGRSISLLPETFIAIIPKSTLVPRMTQAARLIHEQEQKGVPVSSCVSFISGPSNSADIEMNLIVGVHGPVKAAYIVVDDL